MKTELTFPGSLPGNNGKNGLLRMHWRVKKRFADRLFYLVMSLTRNKHPGVVQITLTRYSCGPEMDYDNLVSTGKFPIDAIVKAGIITDDKPAIIRKREYHYEKIKRGESQKTVITIEDIEP